MVLLSIYGVSLSMQSIPVFHSPRKYKSYNHHNSRTFQIDKMRSLIILLGLVAVCHCVSLLDVAKEEWKLFKVSDSGNILVIMVNPVFSAAVRWQDLFVFFVREYRITHRQGPNNGV